MQNRTLALCVALGLLAACSGESSSIVGNWRCEAHKTTAEGDQTVNGEINFASSGKETGLMTMKGTEQGAAIALEASYTGTWKLTGDRLEEEIVDVTLISATINGEPAPKDDMAPLVAGMKGQTNTSTIAISKNILAMNSLGTVTNCSR